MNKCKRGGIRGALEDVGGANRRLRGLGQLLDEKPAGLIRLILAPIGLPVCRATAGSAVAKAQGIGSKMARRDQGLRHLGRWTPGVKARLGVP
jgi:hypothetical protein